MATIIRLNSLECEPFADWRNFDATIRPIFSGMEDPDGRCYLRPVIAKGNIIEGIKARW